MQLCPRRSYFQTLAPHAHCQSRVRIPQKWVFDEYQANPPCVYRDLERSLSIVSDNSHCRQ